jgi:hypothetical protein
MYPRNGVGDLYLFLNSPQCTAEHKKQRFPLQSAHICAGAALLLLLRADIAAAKDNITDIKYVLIGANSS